MRIKTVESSTECCFHPRVLTSKGLSSCCRNPQPFNNAPADQQHKVSRNRETRRQPADMRQKQDTQKQNNSHNPRVVTLPPVSSLLLVRVEIIWEIKCSGLCKHAYKRNAGLKLDNVTMSFTGFLHLLHQ